MGEDVQADDEVDGPGEDVRGWGCSKSVNLGHNDHSGWLNGLWMHVDGRVMGFLEVVVLELVGLETKVLEVVVLELVGLEM